MSYLLKINQEDKSYDIGIFKSEASIFSFIEKIPFIIKDTSSIDYTNYYMNFNDIPEYFEVNYNNFIYILSKFSFLANDNDIFFTWDKIHLWDENQATEKTLINGDTTIDAYSVSNDEVKDYINLRESLYNETKKYYESKGLKVARHGLGSQDGEYVELVNSSILYLLDGHATSVWEKSNDIEDFLIKYNQFLDKL